MSRVAQAGLLAGKRALILGVANDHSIAWGIARAFAAQGAELAFTYQGEGFERRVIPLAESLGAKIVDARRRAGRRPRSTRSSRGSPRTGAGSTSWSTPSPISDKAELDGRFLDTSRANFLNSLDISCYSLVELTRRAAPLMRARRLDPDADLPRRPAGDAELQRDGRGQGGAGERGALPRQRPRAGGHPGQRHLPRADADARRRRDRRRRARSTTPPSATRRCAPTPRWRRWAGRRSISPPTSGPAPPAR